MYAIRSYYGLEEGKAADLFMINIDQLDYVGGLLDPAAFLATIGYGRPVELTMVNGKIVYQDGQLVITSYSIHYTKLYDTENGNDTGSWNRNQPSWL